ncbi:BnaC09g32090D [Brassica napus]|uniref:Uncharacterized protein n=2 Tax=Brassica TaxID=3705 RepID=A0A3P6DL96_BRAOL|nr:unnamed protein product [Brassica napus]CDY45667.1 BnaC09g32090D [Brassica napus]VDD32167.1 unnamed protein product [Brassica oleracea]
MDGRPPFKMPKCWKKFRFERLRPGARMCSSGGKIVLFWDKISLEGYLHHIWSAEISLERLQGGEIWGNIERSNILMPVEPFKAPQEGFAFCFCHSLNFCHFNFSKTTQNLVIFCISSY